MSKTPYELRSETLLAAKDMLDRQADQYFEMSRMAMNFAITSGQIAAESWETYLPKSYSTEDLIKKAQELQEFINNKNTPTSPE